MADHTAGGGTNGTVDGGTNGTNGTVEGVGAPPSDPGRWGAFGEWLQDPAHLLWVRLGATLLALLVAWALVRLADRALTRSAERIGHMRHFDPVRTRALVGRTKPMRFGIRISMGVVVVITVLGIWGLRTGFTSLLAGAGFAGIVIGLAAADTIGDIVAGFMIFYNHPFDIGDWVEIDGVEGIIDDVALGATTLITWENEKVTIPNRLVEGSKVKNFSAARKLRRRLVVGVVYGSQLGRAMDAMVELAKGHPEVLTDPEPSAIAVGFGSSSVDLALRFYVEPVRSNVIRVYTDLVRQVHDTFHERGIQFAFPHVQVVQGEPWHFDGQGGAPGASAGEDVVP